MAGNRSVRCDECRRRHKRCSHILPQPAMPAGGNATAIPRTNKSLLVRLPITIDFTGQRARLQRQPQTSSPHPTTHPHSHHSGPPPLAWSQATHGRLPNVAPTTESESAFQNRDVGMLDVNATPIRSHGPVPMGYSDTMPSGEKLVRHRADSVTMLQEQALPGPKYTCNLCHEPILSEVWNSCRVCGNVDFHKQCVHEGRRIHHLTYPQHGFMQVAREGQEEDVFGGWPAPALQEEDIDAYICNACDRPIDGIRHFCTACPDLDFCDEHFVAGMKDHQSSAPDHIFDHKQAPRAAGPAVMVKHTGSRRARSRRGDTPLAAEFLLKPESARSSGLLSESSRGSPRRGVTPASDNRLGQAAASPSWTTTPTSLPRSRRESGKPPTRRRAGKVPGSVLAHNQLAQPQPAVDPSHFASITEQLARTTPPRPKRYKTYPIERATPESFATKWLFHFHSYIRTWSENSSAAHAADGMQMLHDFDADATLNDFMQAHFSTAVEPETATESRDFAFTNPFQAAAKARQLNQFSVENWRLFRDRKGMIAGQVVATMGYVQLQEVDALLARARETGRIDGWRAALPQLGHTARGSQTAASQS